MCWKWLPLSWSEAGPGSEPAPFPPSVCTLVGNGSLYLSGEKEWLEQELSAGWGGELGTGAGEVLASQPEPQAVFSLLPPQCDCE